MYATVAPSILNSLPAGMLLLPGFTDSGPDLHYNGPDFAPLAVHTTGNFCGSDIDLDLRQLETGSFSAPATTNNGPETGSTAYNVGRVSGADGHPRCATGVS